MVSLVAYGLSAGAVSGQTIRFTNHTELGMLSGIDAFMDQSGFTAQTFNGVQLNEFVAVGATVGIDGYRKVTLLPLAVGWRGIVPTGGVSPYIGLDVGYGFAWLNDETDTEWHKGGFMFNPVVGIRIKSNGNDRFSFSLGYKRQIHTAFVGQPLMGSMTALLRSSASLLPELVSLREDRYILRRMSVRVGMLF